MIGTRYARLLDWILDDNHADSILIRVDNPSLSLPSLQPIVARNILSWKKKPPFVRWIISDNESRRSESFPKICQKFPLLCVFPASREIKKKI